MISYIEGKIIDLNERTCTLLTGNVGYQVSLTMPTLLALQENSTVAFWIYTHVREDALMLYGFSTKDERALFEKLISVSGIGPRGALGMLSVHSPHSIAQAIATGDAASLSHSPGIGKRTAEKIILELKGKLDHLLTGTAPDQVYEVRLALEALGYSPKEIQTAVASFKDTTKDTNTLIKEALTQLR